MKTSITVISDDILIHEFIEKGIPAGIQVNHLNDYEEVKGYPNAAAYFDLSLEPTPERMQIHASLFPTPVFINCVHLTNDDLAKIAGHAAGNIIRINAWPGFLKRNILEVAGSAAPIKDILDLLNWRYEIVPDQPGFITARVVAMIINEAYFALGEEVSTRQEMDIAMKLGTNYPHGPFEWSELIGIKKIYELLVSLSQKNPRYTPAPLLKKEALNK